MRFRLVFLAAACAFLATVSQSTAGSPSTAVGVSEREFRISLYRGVVPPGEVRFNITNFGEDAHNLIVLGPSGTGQIADSGEIRAGKRATMTTRLRRQGTYRLVCTTANHAALGMQTKLVVRKASAAKKKRKRRARR